MSLPSFNSYGIFLDFKSSAYSCASAFERVKTAIWESSFCPSLFGQSSELTRFSIYFTISVFSCKSSAYL